MQNIIQLLPDSVANQIAAGEVVQRPGSVVKELVENAIDAGATAVSIIVKDAGRTLVQVVDNGCGMSEVDARMAFERHATSKIRAAEDLFSLHTFGFRGEALAAIVSIAEVEVKTRPEGSEVGTRLVINGSEVKVQEPVSCPVGTSIAVKNLFYNVPARRKFLKTDATEFRHIENELKRAALCHPEVALALYKDGEQVFDLPATGLKPRIVALLGATKGTKALIDVEVSTQVVQLSGFVTVPENATKEQDKQFLFVNGRYFQSAYFRSAILRAYEQLLPPGSYPSYFIYLTVDTAKIDVNIHPTKTEVKLEDERVIWPILHAAVREAIGKYALAPTLDFDTAGTVSIPVLRPDTVVSAPQVSVDPAYNPFHEGGAQASPKKAEQTPRAWQQLYDDITAKEHPFLRGEAAAQESVIIASKINGEQQAQDSSLPPAPLGKYFQLKGKYILAPATSGLLVIDQARAHRRVLYEQLLQQVDGAAPAQQQLFPQSVQLSPADHALLLSVQHELLHMGLDVRDFGGHAVVVQAMPAAATDKNPQALVEELVLLLKAEEKSLHDNHRHVLASSMAAGMAISAGKPLEEDEMQRLVAQLLACSSPDICPNGKPAMKLTSIEELDRKFHK